MIANQLTIVDWLYLTFLFVALILSFHQAWENFINKRISRFSVDRWMLFLSDSFASKENRDRTKKLSKDPKRLVVLGVYAMLAFIESAHQIYKWVLKNR